MVSPGAIVTKAKYAGILPINNHTAHINQVCHICHRLQARERCFSVGESGPETPQVEEPWARVVAVAQGAVREGLSRRKVDAAEGS